VQARKNEISLNKWSGGTQFRRHGGAFGGLSFPQTNLQAPQFDVLNTPLHRCKAPLLKTFWRRFWWCCAFRNLEGTLVSKFALCWQQCFFFTHASFQARQNNSSGIKLREKKTDKKQANRYQYFCFCSAKILTSKTITEMIENHSEFSCCANSCNKFVSSRSW